MLARIDLYLKYVRSEITPHPEYDDLLFLILDGTKVNFYILLSHVEQTHKMPLMNATLVRKLGGTAAARNCPEDGLRVVRRQKSHLGKVARKFYEGVKGDDDTVRAFEVMSRLRSGAKKVESEKEVIDIEDKEIESGEDRCR